MAKVYKSHAKLFNENYTYRYNCRWKNTVYYIMYTYFLREIANNMSHGLKKKIIG